MPTCAHDVFLIMFEAGGYPESVVHIFCVSTFLFSITNISHGNEDIWHVQQTSLKHCLT